MLMRVFLFFSASFFHLYVTLNWNRDLDWNLSSIAHWELSSLYVNIFHNNFIYSSTELITIAFEICLAHSSLRFLYFYCHLKNQNNVLKCHLASKCLQLKKKLLIWVGVSTSFSPISYIIQLIQNQSLLFLTFVIKTTICI